LTVSNLISEYLPEVLDFLESIGEVGGEEEREEEYRRISKLIRFAQRFYERFLKEEFGVEVASFSFVDKRRVAEQISKEEERRDGELSEPERSKLDLAYRYLEICDQLHGELEFGYSADAADFVEFHEETFPDWLDEIAGWLDNNKQVDLAGQVREVAEWYRHVV
jgi:hypothetical protein